MDKISPKELEVKVEKARAILRDSGAHFVIDTIKDLPGVIEIINQRLAMGLSPWILEFYMTMNEIHGHHLQLRVLFILIERFKYKFLKGFIHKVGICTCNYK